MPKLPGEEKLLYFDSLTRAKGERYFADGRVQSMTELGPHQISGRVLGAEGALYKTNVFFSPDRSRIVTALCNCPVTTGCKHAAALLMHFLANETKTNRPRNVIKHNIPAPVPADIELVLQRFSKAMKPAPPAVKDAATQQFLYAIDQGQTTNPLITAGYAKLRKDGTMGVPKLYPLGEINDRYGHRGELQPEDQKIAQLWNSLMQRSYYGFSDLPDAEAFNMLIARILETGRAYYHGLDGPALTLGELLPGRFTWDTNTASNKMVLRLEVQKDEQLIPCFRWSFPWYLNRQTGEMGPAETTLPPPAMQTLMQLRPLTPAEAVTLPPLIAKLGIHNVIPPPPGTKPIKIETQAVEPTLRVEYVSDEEANPASKKRPRRPKLQLVVPRAEATISFDKDGNVIRKESGMESDNELLAQLEQLGFEKKVTSFLGFEDTPEGSLFELEAPPQSWQQLSEKLPEFQAAGWKISEVESSVRTKILEEDAISGGIEYGGSDWWFNLEIEIEIDGKKQSLFPILAAAIRNLPPATTIGEAVESLNSNDRFVAFAENGTLISLPFERIKAMLLTLHDLLGAGVGKLEMSALAGAELLALADADWKGLERLRKFVERLRRLTTITSAPTPQLLHAELRPYQSEGLAWLNFLAEEKFGGILADDMGLGKTVQVLAHICAQKEAKQLKSPFLVVCPTSVLPNWLAETKRFAPDLRVVSYHGSERHDSVKRFADADLVITTYPIVTRDVTQLSREHFRGIALDESQAIKNDASQISQAVRKLKANYRFCMSGTPIENHLGELWSHFNFLMPGLLADKKTFTSNIRNPIEKQGRIEIKDALANRIKPFVLRRTKEQVATELPDKITIVQPIELTKEQRDLYETIRLGVSEIVKTEIAQRGFNKSQIMVLKALLRLRQVCCEPRLIKQSEERAALAAAAESASASATSIDNTEFDGTEYDGVEQGETLASRSRSAKLTYLIETLDQLCQEGRKILVFSQFTSMLNLIEIELKDRKLDFVRISGDTQDRLTPVERFQNGDVPIFLISLKAGGTGLNLTAADTVIHYDPWWNPAVEDQATDRAHRIGQTKKVMVYKLITQGTIEQRMVELQDRKRKLAGAIYDADGARSSLAFTEADLQALLQPIDA